MKVKVLFFSMLATAMVGSAVAQVENDDMYFNASDRAKLKEARKAEQVLASNRSTKNSKEEELNPTDSYSARNVNPEFTSRSQSETTAEDEEEYFVTNYRYNNATQYNNWNNNFNNWYGSSWYRSNYWGPSIYGWNSPYYGSAYDGWGSPWANPYYRSGWSTSFSFSYGNAWNYGNGYYDPYYGFAYDPYWGSYYSPYCGYGSYYGSPFRSRYSYYPTYVVVTDNNSRGAAYGKRASRSSQYNRETYGGSRESYSDNGGNGRSNGRVSSGSNGRTNSSGRERTEYYNNSWRNANNDNSISTSSPTRSTSTPTRSFNTGSNNSDTRSSSWSTPSTPTRSFDSTPTRSFDSGTRSSGSNSSSGGSRSGSGSRSSRGN